MRPVRLVRLVVLVVCVGVPLTADAQEPATRADALLLERE